MPPKDAFPLERVQHFGVVAVESARRRLADCGGAAPAILSCEYRGVATGNGGYDSALGITKRCTLIYEWHAASESFDERCLVNVQCDNAANQGVPFPACWQTALRCLDLHSVALAAAEAAREEVEGEVECRLLGMAKRTALAEHGENAPGSTIVLDEGTRMSYLLCAQVMDSTWLCHRGSFEDGAINEAEPLQESDLVFI